MKSAYTTKFLLGWLALIFAVSTPSVVWGAAKDGVGAHSIHWQDWKENVFKQAKRENRFVLLDLEAVWCHWCHVMDEKTYSTPMVAKLIGDKYIAVRADQDSHPALSSRYGDWGWPATIVFAPDGSEIVKRRGYIPPVNMISMLQAIVKDPSPGPSVVSQPQPTTASREQLSQAQHQQLIKQYVGLYDADHGGWGEIHKFIDDEAMTYALIQARQGKDQYRHMARQTLRAAQHLIDPVWGGVYQYSDQVDWRSPHYEKIMSYQANYLRHYAIAYALWKKPQYLHAAQAIHRYLETFLLSPKGAFYTSQSADLNARIDGNTYYRLTGKARRKLGMPSIDKHIYARDNGWAIRALTTLYDVTGKQSVLDQAKTAAHYIIAHRGLPGGGFRHGANDHDGPYLGDTLAMGWAFLDLYRATGDRAWLNRAEHALTFIDKRFNDTDNGGFITAAVKKNAIGVFNKPTRQLEENVDMAQFANLAYYYTGNKHYRQLAEQAMGYLASPAIVNNRQFLPGVLLANYELSHQPVHITVVGHKNDPQSQALHEAALRYPSSYLRVDWWDKREGALPNQDVTYPDLDRPAAFACANGACSLPVFAPRKISAAVNRLYVSQR